MTLSGRQKKSQKKERVIAPETDRNISSNKKECQQGQVKINTDLPELIVVEGLAFFTSGFCLCLFKVKGRMVMLHFMFAQTALDMMLNIHYTSQGNSHSFFKKFSFKTQMDLCQPPVMFFADNYQKSKSISTQYRYYFQTSRLILNIKLQDTD